MTIKRIVEEIDKTKEQPTNMRHTPTVQRSCPKEYFKYLKKQIREKYGFKNRVEMIKGIKQIISSENSLSIDEICDLNLVLRLLYEKA